MKCQFNIRVNLSSFDLYALLIVGKDNQKKITDPDRIFRILILLKIMVQQKFDSIFMILDFGVQIVCMSFQCQIRSLQSVQLVPIIVE